MRKAGGSEVLQPFSEFLITTQRRVLMSSLSLLDNQDRNQPESPFVSIKRIDRDGHEYWLARELMGLLGYKQYRRFADAIDRAILSQQNAGNSVSKDFLPEVVATKGRPRQDYRLSKNGVKLVTEHIYFTKREEYVKSNEYSELYYRDELARKTKGETEVITPSGRIDILTSSELIEVKTTKNWKSAIGQILVYGHYYPSHQKRIHLIGQAHSSMKAIIEDHCSKFNINVTWE